MSLDWDRLPQKDRNELVATKVMGADGDSHLALGFCRASPAWRFPNGTVISKCDYHPTENIAQAWEVAEFLHHEYRLSVRVTIYHDEGICVARVFDDKRGWQAESATAPDAICHAAVLAVGGYK